MLFGYFGGAGASITAAKAMRLSDSLESVVAGLCFLIALAILVSIARESKESENTNQHTEDADPATLVSDERGQATGTPIPVRGGRSG